MPDSPTPKSFDHVALWTSERDALADLLCGPMGLHVVERTDDFTLVGADAREGKLTLFDAEPPRERGSLVRIVLRVLDLDAALEQLPDDLPVERQERGAIFDGPDGVGLGLVSAASGALDYDLDHVVLRVADPDAVAAGLTDLGFTERDGRLWIADRAVALEPGGAGDEPERPLLNHLALLVDSADAHIDAARAQGVEVTDIKDAPNTYAGFVEGPEGIRIEFVEHKPTFSLV
jgi:catechol 2,3-dioxygenase-like lactoylglutathione lyase family enzyme